MGGFFVLASGPDSILDAKEFVGISYKQDGLLQFQVGLLLAAFHGDRIKFGLLQVLLIPVFQRIIASRPKLCACRSTLKSWCSSQFWRCHHITHPAPRCADSEQGHDHAGTCCPSDGSRRL